MEVSVGGYAKPRGGERGAILPIVDDEGCNFFCKVAIDISNVLSDAN